MFVAKISTSDSINHNNKLDFEWNLFYDKRKHQENVNINFQKKLKSEALKQKIL